MIYDFLNLHRFIYLFVHIFFCLFCFFFFSLYFLIILFSFFLFCLGDQGMVLTSLSCLKDYPTINISCYNNDYMSSYMEALYICYNDKASNAFTLALLIMEKTFMHIQNLRNSKDDRYRAFNLGYPTDVLNLNFLSSCIEYLPGHLIFFLIMKLLVYTHFHIHLVMYSCTTYI